MPRGSGATSSRSRPTPASFWSAWKSPTWTTSTALRRPSRSARRIPAAIPAPPWQPPPNATTFCACSSPASAAPSAPKTAAKSAAIRWMKWLPASSPCPKARAGTFCFPAPRRARATPTATARRCATASSSCARRASTACFNPAGCSSFPLPNRCWKSISRSPCSCWWTGWRFTPACTSAWSIPSRSAIAKPVRRSSKTPPPASASAPTKSFNAKPAAASSPRPNPSCSASTRRPAPARAARVSATPSIST